MFSISNIPIQKTRLLGLLLFFGDLCVILSTAILSFRIESGNYELAEKNWFLILIFLVVYPIIFYFFELYDINLRLTRLRYLTRIITVNAAGIIFVLILGYILYIKVNRGFLILWGINFIVLFLLWRYIFYKISKKPMLPEKILLVGSDWSILEIIKEIKGLPISSYDMVGIISDKNGNPQSQGFDGIDIIGNRYDLVKIVQKEKINKIIVSTYEEKHEDLISALLECKLMGVQITEAPNFYRKITGKIPIKHVRNSWFIFSSGFESIQKPFVFKAKRLIDVILSFLLLIIAVPLIIIVIILIKLDSSGPVFYVQERLGLNEKPFKLIKFRSMHFNAEEKSGPVWSSKNDSRISRVGKLLRPARLDEIPQLINVLKGEMTFIGPRPERQFFVEKLKKQIPYYSLRFSVKPGITGWAQVKYYYGSSVKDSLEKLQYDIYYIQNVSIILDLYIVLKTLQVMIMRKEMA